MPLTRGSEIFSDRADPLRIEMEDDQANNNGVEMWRIKKLIKNLESARGNGTSMISIQLIGLNF